MTSTGTGTGTGAGSTLTPRNIYLVRVGLPDQPTEPAEPVAATPGLVLPDFLTPELWLLGRPEQIEVSTSGSLSWVDKTENGYVYETFDTGGTGPELAADGNGVKFNGTANTGGSSGALSDFSILRCRANPGMIRNGATVWVVYDDLASIQEGALICTYRGEFRTYIGTSTVKAFRRSPFANQEADWQASGAQAGVSGGAVLVEAQFGLAITSEVLARLNNGAVRSSGSSGVSPGTLVFDYIGAFRTPNTGQADFPLAATVREIVVTHQAGLTDLQLQTVRENLMDRWGIDYV